MFNRFAIRKQRLLAAFSLFAFVCCTALALPLAIKRSSHPAPITSPLTTPKAAPKRESTSNAPPVTPQLAPQANGQFDLSRSGIAGGGGTSSNGSLRLDGTIGQTVTGPTSSNGQ